MDDAGLRYGWIKSVVGASLIALVAALGQGLVPILVEAVKAPRDAKDRDPNRDPGIHSRQVSSVVPADGSRPAATVAESIPEPWRASVHGRRS